MNSSQNILLDIYNDKRDVFKISDIAQLSGIDDIKSLAWRMNYYVRQGRLLNPRKGIYAKNGFKMEELAACLYTPSYISLEYVLQRDGVVFQYDSKITLVSYLNRTIEVGDYEISYRIMKGGILANLNGINFKNGIYIASAERAFLDLYYLNPHYYFDNISILNYKIIKKLLPLYSSKALELRIKKLFENVRHQ
jgi:hypothetical protein